MPPCSSFSSVHSDWRTNSFYPDVNFVLFSGAWGAGAWPHLAPLDSPLKVIAPHLRSIPICAYLQNLKTISAQIISDSAC